MMEEGAPATPPPPANEGLAAAGNQSDTTSDNNLPCPSANHVSPKPESSTAPPNTDPAHPDPDPAHPDPVPSHSDAASASEGAERTTADAEEKVAPPPQCVAGEVPLSDKPSQRAIPDLEKKTSAAEETSEAVAMETDLDGKNASGAEDKADGGEFGWVFCRSLPRL